MKAALYLGSVKELGGAERRLARIFDRIAGPELEISIIVPEKGKKEEIQRTYSKFLNKDSGVRLVILSDRNLTRFQYTLRQHFDVICYFDTSRHELSYILGGAFSGAKRLWILCDYYAAYRHKASWRKNVLFLIYRIFSNGLDSLYPRSARVLQKAVKNLPVSVTPCPFTDKTIFYPERKIRQIVFLARLEKMKGGSLFVHAVALCAGQLREMGYEVVLAGNGSQYEPLKKLVREKGLEDCLKMPGYVSPETYLKKAEVFCSLQEIENYPSQSLIEAISCGCFIIATNVGNTAEIVKEGFGELVDSTPEAVSHAILAYINSSEEEKEHFSVSAVEFAEKKFDAENSSRHYKMLFDKLCDKSHMEKEG